VVLPLTRHVFVGFCGIRLHLAEVSPVTNTGVFWIHPTGTSNMALSMTNGFLQREFQPYLLCINPTVTLSVWFMVFVHF